MGRVGNNEAPRGGLRRGADRKRPPPPVPVPSPGWAGPWTGPPFGLEGK